MPPPLDLSKATKLKDLDFVLSISTIQWITMTLQATKSEILRRITIRLISVHLSSAEGKVHSELHDLDHLLAELWTSRSVLPKVELKIMEGRISGELVASLFPKLTSMGAVEADVY